MNKKILTETSVPRDTSLLMGAPEACQNLACAGFCQTDDFMKLPNGDHADLGTKIEDYVLNPSHWEGRHKARVFESVLGITINDQQVLREAILAAAVNSDEAEALGDNGHGIVYVLRFPLTNGDRTVMILTAWIIRYAEDFPRLITCYIL